MNKIVLIILSVLIFNTVTLAQVSPDQERQELEKERQQLKQELEEKQELLNKNRKVTKENLGQLALINSKVNLQERMINNISRDIGLMDNKITKSQHDVRKLSLLLDTLKQEYAKSMIYSYKNRSNADFLNFIFSSSSFNDAVKRVNYLKSYRSYREMQGENILRTQGLLKERITELDDNKQQKDEVLQTQSKEMDVLSQQQKEKDEVVAKLKAEGKELNQQIVARRKQMQKVGNAISAAIKRAQDEARKEAEEAARKQREIDAKNNTSTAAVSNTKTSVRSRRAETSPATQESVLLPTDADVKLNADFVRNKGSLPWPVDKGYIIMVFGNNELPNKIIEDNPGITIGCDIGSPVKAIFDGEVSSVTKIEDMQFVVIKHGKYFSGYNNLSGVNLSHGQQIHTGQVIGRAAANDDGIGAIDLIITNDKDINLNPELWLRRK